MSDNLDKLWEIVNDMKTQVARHEDGIMYVREDLADIKKILNDVATNMVKREFCSAQHQAQKEQMERKSQWIRGIITPIITTLVIGIIVLAATHLAKASVTDKLKVTTTATK